jgi:hypothetical protein
MTHEYGDPIHSEAMDTAVALALQAQVGRPEIAFHVHVAEAVRHCFCACVLDIEDAIEGGLSGVHSAIVEEVTRLARGRQSPAAA